MMAFAGTEIQTWMKGCTVSELTPYDCRGAYDTPMCTYTSFLGNPSGNCIRCCEGDQCNTGAPPRTSDGAPPRASAGALAALSPIVLSLFSFLVVFLLK